jgi:Zn-dependent membrane protease YugP
MFFMSPEYMIISIIGMALVFIPQMLVMSTYKKFSKVQAALNITGGDVARSILQNAGVNDVQVVPTSGELSDHYDPTQKIIRLSDDIYNGKSISSFGIAAHEVGHAIQDNHGYLPMKLRAGIFPVVNFGQGLGPILIMVGIGLGFLGSFGNLTFLVAVTGLCLYGAAVLFHIVTLPVEFNASFRAIKVLSEGGYLVDDREINGAKLVLTAAALTYVAAALYALIQLLYWASLVFGRNRD